MTMSSSLRGVALVGLTFAAGVIAGIGFERHHGVRIAIGGGHVAVGAAGPGAMLHDHLRQLLDLDQAQDSAVRVILARHQLTVDSSWQVLQPMVRATLDSTFREISGVLRPEQAAKFRSLVETMHPGMHR
jgi:hypothetical protein